MENIISVIAIVVPSVVALASLLVQAMSKRMQMQTERAKIFYQDRISALRGLIKAVSAIERNAQQAIQFRDMVCVMSNSSYKDVWENREGKIPPEMHQVLCSAVYGATIVGKKSFNDEIDNNRIFYPPEVSCLIEKLEANYFRSFPEPLHPESIDLFLEVKIPLLISIKKELIEKSQNFMMLAA